MDSSNEPTQVNRVLDEEHAVVGSGRISSRIRNVIDRQENPGEELQDDDDEHHPAKAVVEGVGEVRDSLVHRFVDRLGKGISLVQPSDGGELDVTRVRDRHGSEAQNDPVDLDRAWVVTLLPGQVRQWIGGRSMQHGAVEVEARTVTWAVKGLGGVVQSDRAAEM